MLVTSTNSEPLETGLYIHSVMAIWPGTVAPAGVATATATTLDDAIDSTAARARIRLLRMSAVSSEARTPRSSSHPLTRSSRQLRRSTQAIHLDGSAPA